MTNQTTARKTDGALPLWVTGAGIVAATCLIAWLLSLVSTSGLYPAYADWANPHAGLLNWLMWVIGDSTEPQFYKSALGGLGMTLGALLAWYLLHKRSTKAGFPVSYGTGLIGWILLSSWVGLILANILFGWTITAETPWQPTFVAFVSVPAATVLVHGGGWVKALTGSVFGALLTTPIAILVVNYVCVPLALPSVVGNVTGMWGGALIAFTIYKVLPWMRPEPAPAPAPADPGPAVEPPELRQSPTWLARRVLADFSEPPFFGNEWASAGLLVGTVLEFLLNPASPVYGSGQLPGVLAAQVISAVLGVILFRRQWKTAGFYPTFIPIVSIAPAIVLTFGATPLVIALAGVLGAITGPPLGAWLASSKLPKGYHPFIGYVMSMTICSAVLVVLLKLLPPGVLG